MISFDNYQKTGMNDALKWFLYLVVTVVVLYLVYRGVLYFWPNVFGPGPVVPPGAGGMVAKGSPGSVAVALNPPDLNEGYGYSSDAWNFQHSVQLGAQATQDPSNDVQKFEQITDPVTGQTRWEPLLMQTPQDYVTNDEFETILNRHVPGYNICALDWATTPSYLRNGDMWFGAWYPSDSGAPLSNLRGACVTPDDIVHPGIFNTPASEWGNHPKCGKNACSY